jgi:hypothetical protein
MTYDQDGIGRDDSRVVSRRMIKNKLLLVAIAASILLPAAVGAQGITIQVGDRPFYNHGARYWDSGYEMIWVPGHMSRFGHHWIHGQYVRGQHRQHDWNWRHDDRRDYQDDYRAYDMR